MSIVFSRDQVRRVDRLAIERFGMTGLVLMENAGRNAADIIDRAYGPGGCAHIFCGTGNNGGDGCVIARHLLNRHWDVTLVMTGPRDRMTHDTDANYCILEAMKARLILAEDAEAQIRAVEAIGADAVLIDALLGTGFTGSVRTPTDRLIDAINDRSKRATVAVDVPSGLDCDTGLVGNTAIRADLTITFVAAKSGFAEPGAGEYLGRVEVADIGAPRMLVDEIAVGDA